MYLGKNCFDIRNIDIEDEKNEHGLFTLRPEGNWADSPVEIILKSLVGFGRSYGGWQKLTESGSLHIHIFEKLKKEFRVIIDFK